jgi:hypothetical protein
VVDSLTLAYPNSTVSLVERTISPRFQKEGLANFLIVNSKTPKQKRPTYTFAQFLKERSDKRAEEKKKKKKGAYSGRGKGT